MHVRVCVRVEGCLNKSLPSTSGLLSKPRWGLCKEVLRAGSRPRADDGLMLRSGELGTCGGQAELSLLNERKFWNRRGGGRTQGQAGEGRRVVRPLWDSPKTFSPPPSPAVHSGDRGPQMIET